ncbi:hypothetical protein SAY86_031766 [Trapa natans]|uniref:NADP-dependent oxidoreductase domain-containing protein n=1 Tax=Trapa natans TaxID=22666 RepID=A0AAN7LMD2_TRANT|nr:hypothetical protein SAY86_031766 [Trapa natans]
MNMAEKIPTVELISGGGYKIPLLGMGMGTATFPPTIFEATKKAILEAIKLGYRHFDTAACTGRRSRSGKQSRKRSGSGWLSRGMSSSSPPSCGARMLILGSSCPHSERASSMQNLKLDYLDLYLIHWPVSAKPEFDKFPVKKENFLLMDFRDVWADMEECQNKGLTKCIYHLPVHVAFTVELNPLWQQTQLRKFCASNGILLTGYAVLGSKGTLWGWTARSSRRLPKAKAKARLSLRSICLRWAFEYGGPCTSKELQQGQNEGELGDIRLGAYGGRAAENRGNPTDQRLPWRGFHLCEWALQDY